MIRLKSLLKEDDIVKNKKTGNVYVVKQMDPSKHDKPTPAEVDKAKQSNGGQIPKGEQPSKPIVQQPQDTSDIVIGKDQQGNIVVVDSKSGNILGQK